jgi:hypothetical protein
VQAFVRRKSQAKRLKDRLHAIWFVPCVSTLANFQCCLAGTAFRWTKIGLR